MQYFYDAAGNRTRTILNGVTTNYTTNNLNQYTTVGGVVQTHDADGNLTFDGVNTYVYDQQNRLIRVSGPDGVAEYEYDAFGKLTQKVIDSVRREYLVDFSGFASAFREFTGAGSLVAGYHFGIGIVSLETNQRESKFFDFDGIGNTVGISNASQSIENRYNYAPFGSILLETSNSDNAFLTGGYFGSQSDILGLVHFGARHYSSELGRFLTPDPLGINSGDTNIYRFASNDAVNLVDPDGLRACPKNISSINPRRWKNYVSGDLFNRTKRRIGIFLFHDNQTVYLERKKPSWTSPQNECQYDSNGNLVPGGGTPNYCDGDGTPAEQSCHTWDDPGGIYQAVILAPLAPLGDKLLEIKTWIRETFDPNQKLPGNGFGPEAFVSNTAAIPYRIDFENYATATAPAQFVSITDQLSTDFDWSSFSLTEFGFGDIRIPIPAGSRYFQRVVRATIAGKLLDVLVEAGIDTATGRVFAWFQSIDPLTQLPPDVLTGFLPPEDGTGRGMGHVSYTIRPRAGLPTGREIRNVALIVFDGQLAISTDQVDPLDPSKGIDPNKQARVTIDAVGPTSSVNPLPASVPLRDFTVSWAGTDDTGGSGVAYFDVYVSVNQGAYALWQQRTTATQAVFSGEFGKTYAFYALATDNVGNRRPYQPTAQAVTRAPDGPSAVAYVAGGGQSTVVGTAFADRLVALATDTAGNPVPGIAVTFAAPATGATASFAGGSATVSTGPDGRATAPIMTASTAAGSFEVVVSVAGITATARTTLTNLAAAPAQALAVSGSGQQARLNAAFAALLRLRLTDTYGNPVPGRTVTFAAPASGASASFAGGVTTAVTGADGIATSAVLTAIGRSGSYVVTGSFGSLSPVPFTLTNTVLNVTGMTVLDRSSLRIDFSEPIATSNLQVSDTPTELADLRVTNAAGELVRGSMIVADDRKSVVFVKTGTGFAAGIHTVTIRSGASAFRSAVGELLDGDGDGIPGGQFATSFESGAADRVLAIPDVVRGPGQDLRTSTATAGIPVTISNGANVKSFEMKLTFDPAKMSVTGATVPAALSGLLQLTTETISPGVVKISGTVSGALPQGLVTLFLVQGRVPDAAAYRSKARLSFVDVVFADPNGQPIAVAADSGLQFVNYPGDTTGDGRYNSLDALRTQRHLVNLDAFFPQFPLTDPLLVADINGDGRINALDPLLMQRYLVNIPVAFLTPPPVASVVQSGLDPKIHIPKTLRIVRGQVLAVPVLLTNTDTRPITVDSFEILVAVDPETFAWNQGRLPDWVVTRYDSKSGVMIIAGLIPEIRLEPGETTTLTTLNLQISPRAAAVDHALNLIDEQAMGRERFRTSLNGEGLVLIPAPTASPDDPVDGRVRVVESSRRGRNVVASRFGIVPQPIMSRTIPAIGTRTMRPIRIR